MGTFFLLIFTVSRAELFTLLPTDRVFNWGLTELNIMFEFAMRRISPLLLLMYKMYYNLIVGFSWENLQYISPLLYSLSLWSIDLSIAILVEVWQGSFDFHTIISFFLD